MQAGETKLQSMIEGTRQYVVPLFQRPYSWEPKEWRNLWADLRDLCELENPRPHFFGSIVTMPTVSVPEGVTKYLLIDGQQRLTTTFVLLALIRNVARTQGRADLAREIEQTLLVNPFKAGTDYFKLQPTRDDRIAFQALMRGDPPTADPSRVVQAFAFFERQYRKEPLAWISTLDD